MDKLRIAQYENALRERRAELAAALGRREGIEATVEPDLFDEIQVASERSLVVETLDRNSSLLRDVEAALVRLRNGAYGACLNCGTEISSKRLTAAPWASLCLECQEQAEEVRTRETNYGVAA